MSGRQTTDRAGMSTAAASTGNVAVDETNRLISADKVAGTTVYNSAGDDLGTIYTLMVDKISGKVDYAVMSFGGFLGIGERYHPLPWKVLTYDTSRGGYVVDLTRQQLEGAPTYAADDEPWATPGYGRNVNDYYGMPY